MTTSIQNQLAPFAGKFSRNHLLGLEELTTEELTLILDVAKIFLQRLQKGEQKLQLLSGLTVCNLFFENSTRTRMSFGLAERRLGADTIDFAASSSSLSKGETFIDTARNVEAMGVDYIVVRHRTPGAARLLSQNLDAGILNAGDGAHEHPTQGLLDILTMRERLGSLEGITVGLVGDIAHSRTARSNIFGLQKLGAKVAVCGPSTLVSKRWEEIGVDCYYNFDDMLPKVDVLNLLRIQFERQKRSPFPSVKEYAELYGMNKERLDKTKDDILVLAPGPINRGVEITPDVADGKHSAILEQVTGGVAVRMAVLWLLAEKKFSVTAS